MVVDCELSHGFVCTIRHLISPLDPDDNSSLKERHAFHWNLRKIAVASIIEENSSHDQRDFWREFCVHTLCDALAILSTIFLDISIYIYIFYAILPVSDLINTLQAHSKQQWSVWHLVFHKAHVRFFFMDKFRQVLVGLNSVYKSHTLYIRCKRAQGMN